MKLLIERFNLTSNVPGRHKGDWQKQAVFNKTPHQTRDLCYETTRRTGMATRIVNPYNGVTLATFKFNPPNKVITTYQSVQFENLVNYVSEGGE